jgi:hypothetical protein
MANEDLGKVMKQLEGFTKNYGELPTMPLRVSFLANGEKWEAHIPFLAFGRFPIFGYPEHACVCSPFITKVLLLYDGRGKFFPGITEDICEKKPQKEGQGS